MNVNVSAQIRIPCVVAGAIVVLGFVAEVYAQSGTSNRDSLRTYELSEIVIGTGREAARSAQEVRRVPIATIVRQDAPSAASLTSLIPSAHLQTNSRGESLIYVRGAGERQVAVFFDGALLNIPWDYRVDMSLIPSGMLGGMAVSKGVPSVVYGTNVIGGAINLQSRSMEGIGDHAEMAYQTGTAASRTLRGTYLWRNNYWSVAASGGYYQSDGMTLPSGRDLPFSQDATNTRTNTDRKITNGFARISRLGVNSSEIGFSVLHVDSEKGIAPEGHIDPDRDRVRYWRYPLWRNTMFILNARSADTEAGVIRATAWHGHFQQQIDQYTDSSYEHVSELEEGEDDTFGIRIVGNRFIGASTVRVSANFLTSLHRQTDSAFDDVGDTLGSLFQRFRQNLFSAGLEVESRISEQIVLLAGASVDGNATPLTGDKPSRKTESAIGMSGGISYALKNSRKVRFSLGRKIRFPTMRELFGEALARFVLNPDLEPETSFQAELSVEQMGSRFSGEVVLFARRTYDTIDQIIVKIDDERKRKRVNLDGSRVLGVEVVGAARLLENLTAEGHVSHLVPRALIDGETDFLTEKPEWTGYLELNYSLRWGLSVQANVRHVGTAYGLDLDNDRVSLPSTTLLGARAALRKYFPTGRVFVEVYAGVNNLTDQLLLPQLGLPGPGREYRLGGSVSF